MMAGRYAHAKHVTTNARAPGGFVLHAKARLLRTRLSRIIRDIRQFKRHHRQFAFGVKASMAALRIWRRGSYFLREQSWTCHSSMRGKTLTNAPPIRT